MKGELVLLVFFVGLCTCGKVFLDIGSSGTKLYLPCDPKMNSTKAGCDPVTGMSDRGKIGASFYEKVSGKEVQGKHLGLAAVAYFDYQRGKGHTFVNITIDDTTYKDVNFPSKAVEIYWKKVHDKIEATKPKNPTVLAIATAGMRHPDVGQDVVEAQCNTTVLDGYDMDPEICDTTPGTEEAWYEWIALQIHQAKVSGDAGQQNVHLTGGVRGIFSMGGASAQLAIPLISSEVAKFENLMKEAEEGAKKSGNDGWFLDTTFPVRQKGSSWKNFIGIYKNDTEWSEFWPKFGNMRRAIKKTGNKVTGKTQVEGTGQPIVAVGVISFLSLPSIVDSAAPPKVMANKHIVGGVNALREVVSNTLKSSDCEAKKNWTVCFNEVQAQFKKDVFFAAVAKAFHANGWDTVPFAFISNTDLSQADARESEAWCDLSQTGKNVIVRGNEGKGKAVQVDKKVVSMGAKTFGECTGPAMIKLLEEKCSGIDAGMSDIKLKYNAKGGFGTACSDTFARLGIAKLLFPDPKITDLIVASGADPGAGALFVSNKGRTGKAIGVTNGGKEWICQAKDTHIQDHVLECAKNKLNKDGCTGASFFKSSCDFNKVSKACTAKSGNPPESSKCSTDGAGDLYKCLKIGPKKVDGICEWVAGGADPPAKNAKPVSQADLEKKKVGIQNGAAKTQQRAQKKVKVDDDDTSVGGLFDDKKEETPKGQTTPAKGTCNTASKSYVTNCNQAHTEEECKETVKANTRWGCTWQPAGGLFGNSGSKTGSNGSSGSKTRRRFKKY